MSRKIMKIILATAAVAIPVQAAHADHHETAVSGIEATVIGADGKELGTVTLEQTVAGVLVSTNLAGLPEGEHAFHIHAKGLCDIVDGFKSAGGHYAPGGHMHGLRDPAGPHAGDMPNQFVGAGGVLRTQVLNTAVTLGEGPNTLADADGSALVIHAGPDDYVSQPSGAAGGRIACAVLVAPES